MSRRMMMGCVNGQSFDVNTKLLLHMDGVQGETTFEDASINRRTIVRVGDTNKATDRKKFGTAAGVWDGTGDALVVASNDDFGFGTGDFLVEMWIYPVAWNGGVVLFSSNVTNGLQFGQKSATEWGVAQNGVAWKVFATGLPSINAWNHVAASRVGGTTRIFLNGAVVASGTDNTNYAAGEAIIGGNFNGSIDEFYLQKSVGRSSAFTPPTEAYLY